MDVFCPIIKIDESFKPTHLQSNRSILNVWLGSSQKLGLRINDNGSKSSHSPNRHKSVGVVVGMANPLRVYGHRIFCTPVIKKHSSTLGAGFLTQSLSRSRSFLLLLSTIALVLEGLMPTNASFLGWSNGHGFS
jgi:cytochrome b561